MDATALFDSLQPASAMPQLNGPGVYIFCLRNPDALPAISAGRQGLVYAGRTEHGLEFRNHYVHAHSGFSTFRRSLGALLKQSLGLVAVPRSAGRSRSNVVNYRFDEAGEQSLSLWMKDNLLGAQLVLGERVRDAEHQLLTELEPPLNLTGWPNPQRAAIKELRAVCVREADLIVRQAFVKS